MNNYINCILCNNNSSYEIISKYLRDSSNGHYNICKCLSCGHTQINPLPREEEQKRYYDNDQQVKDIIGYTDIKLQISKSEIDTQRRLNWILSVIPPEGGTEIIDIGCGYGYFVDQATKKGYKAYGIDISKERIKLAEDNFSGTFINGILENDFIETKQNGFSIVTLFQVIEHVANPCDFINDCFRLVKNGGYLLIEVPNLCDELIDYIEAYRNFYWQKAHLSYFDAPRLELLINRLANKNYLVSGLQRYGIENLMHWIDKNEPQLHNPSYHSSELLLAKYENLYKKYKEERFLCDSLIATIQKIE